MISTPNVSKARFDSTNSSSPVCPFNAMKYPPSLTNGTHNSDKIFKRATARAVTISNDASMHILPHVNDTL